jgi:hypothetical protein
MGEWMYRSTRHKLGVSGHLHAYAALPLGEEHQVPIGQEVGSTTWRSENSWSYWDSNSDPSVVQPVTTRYTDYATVVPLFFGLDTRWRWIVSFKPRSLYSRGKNSRYLVGPRTSRDVVEKRTIFYRESNPSPSGSLTIYQLSYPGSAHLTGQREIRGKYLTQHRLCAQSRLELSTCLSLCGGLKEATPFPDILVVIMQILNILWTNRTRHMFLSLNMISLERKNNAWKSMFLSSVVTISVSSAKHLFLAQWERQFGWTYTS